MRSGVRVVLRICPEYRRGRPPNRIMLCKLTLQTLTTIHTIIHVSGLYSGVNPLCVYNIQPQYQNTQVFFPRARPGNDRNAELAPAQIAVFKELGGSPLRCRSSKHWEG